MPLQITNRKKINLNSNILFFLQFFSLFLFQYNKLCEKNTKKCSPTCSDSCTIHPVQQGDVSSTEPHLSESSLNGSPNPDILAQFSALEHYISTFGWALLQLNSDGIIETVTENIKDLIHFTPTDLIKQPIYSYLHAGDHAKLSPLLNNMSFQVSNWDRQEDGQSAQNKRNIQKRIRMLVKHPESGTETMEQKQQRQDIYEEVVMYAAAPFNKGNLIAVFCTIPLAILLIIFVVFFLSFRKRR